MGKQKVVLAFSGGLDTSFCVKYLSEDKGYDVYTAIANTGGFSKEELANIEKRALALGAVKHATLDIEQEYYEKSIKYMIYGDILQRNNRRMCLCTGMLYDPAKEPPAKQSRLAPSRMFLRNKVKKLFHLK